MLTVVTMLWDGEPAARRTRYTAAHVRALARQVAAHLTLPHDIVCLTDDVARDVGPDVQAVGMHEAVRAWPKRYPKVLLWSPLMRQLAGRRMLYLDLDTLVVGDLTPLVTRSEDVVLWREPSGRTHYNTSMVLADAGARPKVWADFDVESAQTVGRRALGTHCAGPAARPHCGISSGGSDRYTSPEIETPMRHLAITLAALTALPTLAAPAAAQRPYSPDRLTAEDYARAERFLGDHVDRLVFGADVRPVWIDDDRFWYRNTIPEGAEFVLVDPAAGTRERAFDHERLAAALSAAAREDYEALELPFRSFAFVDDGGAIVFLVDGERYLCELRQYRCAAAPMEDDEGGDDGAAAPSVVSPDGRLAAFVREHDLWVRDLETGRETRLTTDGEEHFGYATNNAGWTRSDRPVLVWSPDSRRIATFQHDARGVGEMYLTSTNVGHPRLEAWRYPLVGDSAIFRIHRVVIDLEADDGPRVVRLRMPPDPHRSTVCDHVVCGGEWADVTWTPDGSRLVFVSSSRDHRRATLRVADPETGEVRDVLEERVETFYESGYRTSNWRVLPETDEVIWYSRRDDWGHLYLYDLSTGRLKHQVTEGDWNALRVLRVDEDERTVTFVGNEREPGDPYFMYAYRVSLDGGEPVLLTPDSANHDVSLSPSGRYLVDRRSTPTTPPVTAVRDARDGRELLRLEEADISRLVDAGWRPPTPFSVKARDGETDLYGLMYRPTRFDPSRRYPIINYIYPGPQSGSVGGRSFSAARRDHQAIAELGFIVVAIDAMGTPLRSHSFHAAYYGDMGDNGLPDQVAGMRQLAERHAWIDLDRAGIWGHSGGGFAAARALFDYPDFFEVGVSQAGNHDNRNYEDDWAEKWQGLLETYPDGTTNYDNQANQLVAEELEGRLLLAHGTMDSNVPPYSTLLVVDALIEANKDFDLILFPNRRHGFAMEPYMIRRRWDYFVEHLLGAEPPEAYEFGRERAARAASSARGEG
ncbi:MAG: DPP IV N-terminal domain-containing protein [Gemmatimonadota bacterium]